MGTEINPKIGLDNVVIAKLLADNAGTVKPSYDTPIAIKGAVNATVNPNSSVETDYGDNGAIFVTDNRANTEISLEFTGLDADVKAQMLGQERNNGITIEKPLDQAPYFALGFRVWIGGTDENGNKIYEYFWFAKGKFSVPESGAETKKDSVNFQHETLTAQFVQTLYSKDGNGGVICAHARSDKGLDADVAAAWFDAPILDTDVDLGAVTVTAVKTTLSKITITGAKVGGASFGFANARYGENIGVYKNGALVEGSITTTIGASPTIVFTANSAFTGGDKPIVVVTENLKDTNGVSVTGYTVEITM